MGASGYRECELTTISRCEAWVMIGASSNIWNSVCSQQTAVFSTVGNRVACKAINEPSSGICTFHSGRVYPTIPDGNKRFAHSFQVLELSTACCTLLSCPYLYVWGRMLMIVFDVWPKLPNWGVLLEKNYWGMVLASSNHIWKVMVGWGFGFVNTWLVMWENKPHIGTSCYFGAVWIQYINIMHVLWVQCVLRKSIALVHLQVSKT